MVYVIYACMNWNGVKKMIALRKYHDRVYISSITQIGNSLIIKTDKGLIEFEFKNGHYEIITDTIKG